MRYPVRAILAGSAILVALSVWAITSAPPPPLTFVDDLRSMEGYRDVYRGPSGNWQYDWVYAMNISEFEGASAALARELGSKNGKSTMSREEVDGIRSESWNSGDALITLRTDRPIMCGNCAPPWNIRADEVEIRIWGRRPPSPWEQLLLKLELIPPP